jgi:hypothetical protein
MDITINMNEPGIDADSSRNPLLQNIQTLFSVIPAFAGMTEKGW